MLRFMIRFSGKLLLLAMATTIMAACGSNRKEAASTAKTFLQAYYVDLDFGKAQALCSDASKPAVAEQEQMVALNPYAIEEIPALAFKQLKWNADNPNTAVFIYTINRAERTLPLHKFNGKWLVDLQGGTVEMGGAANRMELENDSKGGFAASEASGPIVYKKRKKNI